MMDEAVDAVMDARVKMPADDVGATNRPDDVCRYIFILVGNRFQCHGGWEQWSKNEYH
jgi:hypothetical protein